MRIHAYRIFAAVALPLCVHGFQSAHAAGYPERPVRLVVPFAPGGPTDILARLVSRNLVERWGQQIVVDNRPGAAGNIGAELVAKSQPDGHTLLMGTVATHGINPGLYKKLAFDAVKDFAPISRIAAVPNVLVVHPSVPVRSVPDLLALARSRPDALNYASSGNGTASHLAAELFKSMAAVHITHIPYKSAAPSLSALLGAQVQLSFGSVVPTMPHLKAKRLRALGVTAAERVGMLPDVPTVAESGVPGYESMGWTGLLAPAGTPKRLVDELSRDVGDVLHDPGVRNAIEASGAVVVASKPDAFAAFIRAEIAKWADVIRVSGARLD